MKKKFARLEESPPIYSVWWGKELLISSTDVDFAKRLVEAINAGRK